MADSCIILGLAKTGTTGQYKLAKDILAERYGDVTAVFEPTRRPIMRNLSCAARAGEPVVTKIMLAREEVLLPAYAAFSKRLLVVRDPRDMVISFLLFRPMLLKKDLPPERMREKFLRFRDAIQSRVDGGDRSVVSLHKLADSLRAGGINWQAVAKLMDRQIELENELDLFVSHYEKFVADDRAELRAYLGAPEGASTPETILEDAERDRDDWLSHISRSGGSGEWKQWFTQEDVDFFRPLFERYMNHFGYDDDWSQDGAGPISAQTSVDYLDRKFARLTEQYAALHRSGGKDGISPDNIDLFRRKADDGDLRCIKVLLVHLEAEGGTEEEIARLRRKRGIIEGSGD